MNRIDEKELKKLFTELKSSNNNRVAFETLYQKYNKLVYRIAFTILKNKEDSEDVVQAVFSKIYTLSKDKLPLDNISTWIYSVTKNESISLFRKKKNTLDLDSIYEIADTDNEINNIVDQDSYNRLISRLNDKEKEVVSLKVLTNLTFDEIAKLLNESAGTVKWRYYKSIHTLKLLLSNLGMFIITFVIGLKTMTINKNKIQSEQSTAPDKEANQEKEDSQNITESIIQEETKNTDLEDVYKEENNIKQEETKEEIQVPVDNQDNNINYYDIGIIAISGVFLLFTIIFIINFIKHQLKRKVKASK